MQSSKQCGQDAHRSGWVWLKNRRKNEGYKKEHVQGTESEGKETGTQINDLEQNKEINIRPKQNEETRIQKNEERLRNLWDNFKHSKIQIIWVWEGKEEEQEIENLFENIMKENFPNLAKKTDFQKFQEAQRIPKKLDPRSNTPRHIIIKLPKMKDKERIFKAAREKETVTWKGVPIKTISCFLKKKKKKKKKKETNNKKKPGRQARRG